MKHFPIFLLVALLLSCSPKKEATTNDKKSTATSIPIFNDVDPSVRRQVNDLLEDYFNLNITLIDDNVEEAKKAAAWLAESIKRFEKSKLTGPQLDFYYIQTSNLQLALGNLASSPDISVARTELATVSEAMYGLVKAFHPNDQPIYYHYCPMARDNKGATWLSTHKELANPYMGKMMLECGRNLETIN